MAKRFQFSLRRLLLVVTACAVTLSALRMGEPMFAVVMVLFLSAAIVAALIEKKTPPLDRLLLFYIVAMFLFLVALAVKYQYTSTVPTKHSLNPMLQTPTPCKKWQV